METGAPEKKRREGSPPRSGMFPGGRVPTFACLLLLALAAWDVHGARAVDRVNLHDQEEEISALRFGSFHGWSELLFRATRDEADMLAVREAIFAPGLHLETSGSAYHERFLSFHLRGTLSLELHKAWRGLQESQTLPFSDYNLRFHFFKDHPANLTLFALREDSWVSAPYAVSYRVRSTSSGGDFRLSGWQVPLVVSYSTWKSAEEIRGGDRVIEKDRVSASLRHDVPVSRSDLAFRYLDFRQNLQPQAYETVNAFFNNTLRPGARSESQLRSGLRYFNQYGTFAKRFFTLTEDARLKLGRTLEGTLGYQFSEQTGSSSVTAGEDPRLLRSQRGDAGLRHVLYGSLRTTLGAYASRKKVFDSVPGRRQQTGDDYLRGLNVRLGYRRKTAHGRIFLGVGFEAAREDLESEERLRSVSDESHILTDGDEPQLDNPDVDVPSIVIRDDSGFIVYQEGFDYQVVPFGRYVRVFRVPGGSIANGQEILVDYRYLVPGDETFDVGGRSFDFRFTGKKFYSVFYRYNQNTRTAVSGPRDRPIEDQRLHRVGIELENGGLRIGDEYEVNRLLTSEFLTNRLYGTLDVRVSPLTRMNLGANYTSTRFVQPDRNLRVVFLNARIVTRSSSGLKVEGEGWLRVDRGNQLQDGLDSEVAGVRLLLTQPFRALTFTLGAFYQNAVNNNRVDDLRSSLFMSLRREF